MEKQYFPHQRPSNAVKFPDIARALQPFNNIPLSSILSSLDARAQGFSRKSQESSARGTRLAAAADRLHSSAQKNRNARGEELQSAMPARLAVAGTRAARDVIYHARAAAAVAAESSRENIKSPGEKPCKKTR